jgi:hypothetical protein
MIASIAKQLDDPDSRLHRWFCRLTELKFRVLARPFDRALQDRTNLVGAEIGVLGGEHAKMLLRRLSLQSLYLVDPYQGYTDYSQGQLDQAFRKMQSRLRRYSNKCLIKLPSTIAANHCPPLDFAYLDGAHDYLNVKADIAAWWPRIKPNGILGGHDIENGFSPRHNGVVQAVTEFALAQSLPLYIRSPDWWVQRPLSPPTSAP